MVAVGTPSHNGRTLVPVFTDPPSTPYARVVVTVPALNEERSIAGVVRAVTMRGFDCLVIDDGSTDRTGAIARRAGAIVVRHLIPLGQGAALQTGIDWALSHGADAIVTFDGDGQHRGDDIPALLDALSRDHADFVLGSRFLGTPVTVPRARRLLLRAAVSFTRVTTGMRVTDTHNGLRAMTARGARAIHLRQNRMAHASEIIGQIARSGLPWVEVPVTIDYDASTLEKGQKNSGAVAILCDLLMGGLQR